MALIILQQIVIMSLYMLCGYWLYKTGKITDEGSKSIANLLPWAVIPSTLINSLQLSSVSFFSGIPGSNASQPLFLMPALSESRWYRQALDQKEYSISPESLSFLIFSSGLMESGSCCAEETENRTMCQIPV